VTYRKTLRTIYASAGTVDPEQDDTRQTTGHCRQGRVKAIVVSARRGHERSPDYDATGKDIWWIGG
jgi:hypothetical protein